MVPSPWHRTRTDTCPVRVFLAAGRGRARVRVFALDHTFSEKDVHAKFGEPQSTLYGFWRDVYALADGTEAIIYYDSNGYVSEVKVN